MNLWLQLFWAFFQIGVLAFGGGYATLPLIQARAVNDYGWITVTEFTDILTISQMTPGPIGINAATFVGTKVGGLFGAVIATLGVVAPSFIIVLALALLYKKYNKLPVIQSILGALKPASVGLIAASGVSIAILTFWGENAGLADAAKVNIPAVILSAAGFIVMRRFKPNQIYVLLGAGAIGLVLHLAGLA
jgi:chromate transporter